MRSELRIYELTRIRYLSKYQVMNVFFLFGPSTSQLHLRSKSLRYAARAVGSVSGLDTGVEEILGGIYSSSCVGVWVLVMYAILMMP